MNCNNKLMATYKKFGFILCCLLLFLILIGVLFEKDRKFGNSRYNPSSYYITLWPLPILGNSTVAFKFYKFENDLKERDLR